jgi:hypothetical protein
LLGVKESRGKKQQCKSGDSVFHLCEPMKLAINTEDLKEMLKEYPDLSTDVIKKNGGTKKGEKLFEEEGTQLFFTKL